MGFAKSTILVEADRSTVIVAVGMTVPDSLVTVRAMSLRAGANAITLICTYRTNINADVSLDNLGPFP